MKYKYNNCILHPIRRAILWGLVYLFAWIGGFSVIPFDESEWSDKGLCLENPVVEWYIFFCTDGTIEMRCGYEMYMNEPKMHENIAFRRKNTED